MIALYLHRRNLHRQHEVEAVIEDMLSWAGEHRQEAVDQAIVMLDDFCRHGHECVYLKKLKGSPISELKSHARGGIKGGVRVYLYWRSAGKAAICGAEIKEGDAPGRKLMEAVRWFKADTVRQEEK